MRVYDVVHGYQPFTNELISSWVETNLDRVFIPTSEAMSAGLVRHNVQLQGWTIDAWLAAPKGIRKKAETVLRNLRSAAKMSHIEAGFSAYSHCLLPLVGDELAYAQMRADYETVREHIAEPGFFWFPECAVNAAKLEILCRRFPAVVAVIPDGAVGGGGSRFARVTGRGFGCRAAISNTLVKDVLMNSTVYERPPYVPKSLDWEGSRRSMRDAGQYRRTLTALDGRGEHVVVRDWENGESRDALRTSDGVADVAAMMDADDVEFMLLCERKRYETKVKAGKVVPSCWEPLASADNPYPYWSPTDAEGWRERVTDHWLRILEIYDCAFREAIEGDTGLAGLDAVDAAFRKRKFYRLFKKTSPALLSCLPWHLLARDEWEKFPDFPMKLLEKVVYPNIVELAEYSGQKTAKNDLKAIINGFIRTIEAK